MTAVRLGAMTLSAIALAAVASRARAGLVPGGGALRSDCYVELAVQGVESPGPQVTGGRVVTCIDGDPCDRDGRCDDDSCDFGVAVCTGQTDANLPACTPAGVRSLTGRARRVGGRRLARGSDRQSSLFQSTFPVDTRSGPACGRPGSMTVRVRVRPDGRRLPGRLALSLAASAARGATPARDRDRIVLTCLPRTSACPQP